MEFSITDSMIYVYLNDFNHYYYYDDYPRVNLEIFGEFVFFTKEEAEVKLKEANPLVWVINFEVIERAKLE